MPVVMLVVVVVVVVVLVVLVVLVTYFRRCYWQLACRTQQYNAGGKRPRKACTPRCGTSCAVAPRDWTAC